MTTTTSRTEFHQTHGIKHLYDNGCCLCDALEELRLLVEDEATVAPWLTYEQALAQSIRSILDLTGWTQMDRERRAGIAEMYAKSFGLYSDY